MEKRWILLLRLEAPLQSYGERAKWDFRDTAYFPTKSGVIGILACALGLKRGSPEIVSLTERLVVSVRADNPGSISRDFQTVSGIIRTAEGGQRGNKGELSTITSERQYLEDASFLVAICADYSTLERCRDALLSPVWPPYLGRKSCVPTRPVFEALTDEYGSVQEAFSKYQLAECAENAMVQCQYDMNTGNLMRSDTIIGDRKFAYRQTYQDTVEVEVCI